ncbi:NADH-quinone oxidoreductase subunit NuoF [Fervidobacterium nodosum]|uniref:NADH dehydrogenase (Quinone) n=1 Tax=Fervidobacterium nodosum (strain ATCC 35602 / DSM 5306 / Rt17-B1) TaxID=381764 RepID=A7HLQ8_FERNB|nr:NADH-quinone oxidoreductase subunit NuoF [Fervidobacterium nodosum]ABS60841.1 NADH dehydrogenase (quinone) [Fervidobacterium nodosum Rt17-B1]PHJ13999.1 NADP oxidoreductase [Fervidobacterium sp. SC_NGM5_G05]
MTPITVLISVDSNSILLGAREYANYLKELVNNYNLSSLVTVLETVSLGSYNGVVMHVLPDDVYYSVKSKEEVLKIVEEHLLKGRIVWDLTIQKSDIKAPEKFALKETRIVTRNIGVIDPRNIDEYIARDGYFALSKALKMTPEEVIKEIKDSGLRGRGGAGFPTGLKWEFTAKTKADQKYIVCNADEGEPGTFKDRLIMEGDPHSVIEAMIIAGYAVGATKGYIYIRGEYYNSVENLKKAIKDAYEYGFLGEDILGSGFNFDLTVRLGAGAYVCGEETALLESIEGKSGRPRLKPPYPPQSGLFGKPTVINNVETLANVPQIILNGAQWFRSIGTPNSPGTKVFCLVGDVNRRGMVELPMGVTVREVLYGFGGGVKGGRELKMVQTGGLAGTFIGPDKLDVPLDYDSMKNYGVSLGSGVILAIDDSHCVVDIALNTMEFFRHESCGKCTPCREGTRLACEILEKMTKFEATMDDLKYLEQIAILSADASFCGLGQSINVPLLSLINNFKEEFIQHIKDKYCKVGLCKEEKKEKKKAVAK